MKKKNVGVNSFKKRNTIRRKKRNTIRRKKRKTKYSLKRGKNRGGGPSHGSELTQKEKERNIMSGEMARERCRELRKLSGKREKIFQYFSDEVSNLPSPLTPHRFKCFFECTENRIGPIIDFTNKPVIFSKVIEIVNKSNKINGEFVLEQMPELTGNWIDVGTIGERYQISDVSTKKRANWFLRDRVPNVDTPILIVTHQDFMKKVIELLENYPHIEMLRDPRIQGDIPNLRTMLIRYSKSGVEKDIFLMRHCFACHNIKDNSSMPWLLGKMRNEYTERLNKGRYWNYGELSICIQPDEDYIEAVRELKTMGISLDNLHFACSPLFRAMFTLVKVLQFINPPIGAE